MADAAKYMVMAAQGCIPACMADGQTVYESKGGLRLVIYTTSTVPKRLAEKCSGRGVPYRAKGKYGPVYGWLPPDYPLRPIEPRKE